MIDEHEQAIAALDERLRGDIAVLEDTMYRELGRRDEQIAEAHRLLLDEALKLELLRADVNEGRLQGEQISAELEALTDRVETIERDKLVADSAIELLRHTVRRGEQRTAVIEEARSREYALTFKRLIVGFLLAIAVFVGILLLLYLTIE